MGKALQLEVSVLCMYVCMYSMWSNWQKLMYCCLCWLCHSTTTAVLQKLTSLPVYAVALFRLRHLYCTETLVCAPTWRLYYNIDLSVSVFWLAQRIRGHAWTSLPEQYTTVDEYLKAGCFDPKVFVKCLHVKKLTNIFGQNILKVSIHQHSSTLLYCPTSRFQYQYQRNIEPLQLHMEAPLLRPPLPCSCRMSSTLSMHTAALETQGVMPLH